MLARGNAGQDLANLLAAMADLARSYIDLGQNAAAAILSMEAVVQSAYDAGSERPGAQEARMLRALAHLRMDRPAEAVLQALPVYRLEDADLTPEAAELLGVFDAELSEAAAKRGAARRAGQRGLAALALGSAVTIAQNLGTAGDVAGDSARLNVQALVNLELLAEDQGQMATAEARYTDAVGVLQSTDAGDESAGWSLVLGQLGGLSTTAGRLDEAEGLLQKSLDLAVERDGEQSRNVALSLYELARLQAYAGKVQAASDTARRAIAIARATMGADDPDLTAIYLAQAGLLERTGRPKQARAALEAALSAAGAQAGAARPRF